MKRQSLAKLLGGLALLGPISAPVWAGGKTDRTPVQIYSSEDVIQRSIAQNTVPPEQAVPQGTESMGTSNANGTAEVQSGAAEAPSGIMVGRTKISGWIDQGVTINEDSPHDRQNFGRLFDDRSNDYRFNQAVLRMERALDPQPCCSDWGFALELMYGSDARFIHSLGFMDNITNATVQPDIIEAYVTYHSPMLTSGGVDFKVGQFVTLQGAEVINAPSNPLYSHSYIFNFGIPFKHTGVMATTHLSDQLDLFTGLTFGINTGSFVDNNDAIAFDGGALWTSCDKASSLGIYLHMGPENPEFHSTHSNPNGDLRTIIDIVATSKLNECWTSTTEGVWGRDNGFDAEWYGVSQYFVYKVNDCVSFIARGEVFRDDDNFVVGQFAKNDDLINIERGDTDSLDPRTVGGGDTTYGALTLGLNVKPYENLLFRPEVRWDWASGNKPFNNSSDNDMFTFGVDMIWSF